MSSDRDPVVSAVDVAVRATLAGKHPEAEAALADIVVSRPSQDTSALVAPQGETGRTGPRQTRKTVPVAVQMALFRRDNFTCRYCGRQTLFTPLVRLLSGLYPATLPYHPHGKFGMGHLLYWTHTASIEHVVAVAAGGSNDPENLITACYGCNDQKSDWPLERLGWRVNPPATVSWDGLSDSYPALYVWCSTEHGQVESVSYHSAWLRAVPGSHR